MLIHVYSYCNKLISWIISHIRKHTHLPSMDKYFYNYILFQFFLSKFEYFRIKKLLWKCSNEVKEFWNTQLVGFGLRYALNDIYWFNKNLR